jgi:hypothetical protein
MRRNEETALARVVAWHTWAIATVCTAGLGDDVAARALRSVTHVIENGEPIATGHLATVGERSACQHVRLGTGCIPGL